MEEQGSTSTEQRLFQAIVPYIATNVVSERLQTPEAPAVIGAFWQGTLMFADVSGFTAMSERLAGRGREGAEELTRVLNGFFTTMLDIVHNYGGDVLKFGGDALLVYFPANGATAAPDSQRAVRCALDMQETMQQFRRVQTLAGDFALTMSIGVSRGEFFAASVGQADIRLEQIVTGRPVNLLAKAEALADAGEVLITRQTYQHLRSTVETGEKRDNCYSILALKAAVPKCPTALPTPEPHSLGPSLQALAPYLPRGILTKIEADPSHAGVEGEHRRVTVMFVNFHDMSRIIGRLGAGARHEILDLLNSYFVTMQSLVQKYGGVITRCDPSSRGDKLLILFGAPTGHENDEERAVLCALDMMEALTKLNATARVPLYQRIGINSGDLFVGDVGSPRRREYTVMGDAVNLAARLMSVARQSQIILGPTTYQRVSSSFVFRHLEPVRVKGKAEPVRAFEVLGRRQREYAALRVKPGRAIVGRERELQTIQDIIAAVLEGRGRLLSISGEAGVGKSRLAEELIALCLERGMAGLRGDCPSYAATMAYLPWIALLRSHFGIRDEDEPTAQQARVAAGLADVSKDLEAWAPLVGRVLGLDIADNELTGSLDAEMRKRRFFDLTLELIRNRARQGPLLLLFEDVHWMDTLSRELLDHVARAIQDEPLLIVAAHRPDIRLEGWQGLPHYHSVVLEELSSEAAITLVNNMLHLSALPERLKTLILSRSQGNPFYLEEVVQSLLDLGHLSLNEETGGYRMSGGLAEIEIPDTIEGVIMSRVDQLPERSRNVLRVASVIGRTFRYQVLQRIMPYAIEAGELRSRLGSLESLGLVLVENASPDPEYVFKHVLTQEVVYDSLLFARRRELHHRVGDAIENLYSQRLSEHYELLALHYRRAESWRPALRYHQLAGEKALGLYANQQAIDYFTTGLNIAGRVEADTADEEITLNELLGDTCTVVGQHERALEHYASARQLLEDLLPEEAGERLATLCRKTATTCERLGEYETAFGWLDRGLQALGGRQTAETAQLMMIGGLIHHRQGRHTEALERGLRAVTIAHESRSDREIGRANNLIGVCYQWLGDLATAIEFFAKGLAVYEQAGDVIGIATTHINLGNCYFLLGQWGRSVDHHQRGLEIRQKIGDVDRIAMVSLNLGITYLCQGDLTEAVEAYTKSQQIWEQTGYSYGVGLVHTNLGAAFVQSSEWARALSHLSSALEIFRIMQSETLLPEIYRLMAEAHLGLGRTHRALNTCQRSLELALKLQMRQEEGSCRRVVGQIYRAMGDIEMAKDYLQESLRIAEQVGFRYEVGRVLYQLALLYMELWTSRQDEEAKGLAQRELRGAIAVFERLGAKLDLARAKEAHAQWERMTT